MKKQKFNRVAWQCAAFGVCLLALTVSSSAYFVPNLFSWHIVPNIGDGYESSQFPQPVCAKVGTNLNLYLFTNYQSYTGETIGNLNDYNSIRVGQVLSSNDTYQLLPDKLPGKLWREFAAASVIKIGDADSTIYLFGGKKGLTGTETDEVYSYKPGLFSAVSYPIQTDTIHTIWGHRAGAVAVPANGKIYLFGGYYGNTVLNQVQVFDPNATGNPFTILPQSSNMPVGLANPRGMAKAGPNGNVYIYLVGGSTTATPNSATANPYIYRFHVNSGVWATVKDAGGTADMMIPSGSGVPMTTWDRSGNVRIIASGGQGNNQTWANMQAWILTDDYSVPSVSKASLTTAPYINATRARDNAGVAKCGDVTYLIGGTYGKAGSTLQNKGRFIDKLVRLW